MSKTYERKYDRVLVRGDGGAAMELVILRTLVTEQLMGGESITYETNAQISKPNGEPVNFIEDGVYEDMEGKRWLQVT